MGGVKNVVTPDWEDPLVAAHYCRLHFVDKIRHAIFVMRKDNADKEPSKIVKELITEFTKIRIKLESDLVALEEKENKLFEINRYK